MTTPCPVPIKLPFLLAGCLLSCSAVLFAGELPADGFGWTLRRDRDDVQIYTRKVENSPYEAVMATSVLADVPLSAMVALILDVEACPTWADRCLESRVHERISDTDMLIYTHNNLPFPIKDRDILSRIHWSQDPQTLEVTMTSEAAKGILEETQGVVRLTDAEVNWTFRPLENGKVQVINDAHIDPGTALPGWLINMLQVETPFKTMQGFRETVRQEKYRDARFDFVVEPN